MEKSLRRIPNLVAIGNSTDPSRSGPLQDAFKKLGAELLELHECLVDFKKHTRWEKKVLDVARRAQLKALAQDCSTRAERALSDFEVGVLFC